MILQKLMRADERRKTIMTTTVTRAKAHHKAARRTTIRVAVRLAFVAATFLGVAFTASSSKAEVGWDPNYPFCVQQRNTGIVDCSHTSWDECQFTANGIGYCRVNPFYAGPPPRTAAYHKRRPRH
jgi:hypothetical protein